MFLCAFGSRSGGASGATQRLGFAFPLVASVAQSFDSGHKRIHHGLVAGLCLAILPNCQAGLEERG